MSQQIYYLISLLNNIVNLTIHSHLSQLVEVIHRADLGGVNFLVP